MTDKPTTKQINEAWESIRRGVGLPLRSEAGFGHPPRAQVRADDGDLYGYQVRAAVAVQLAADVLSHDGSLPADREPWVTVIAQFILGGGDLEESGA
jgi:hypothetical protein